MSDDDQIPPPIAAQAADKGQVLRSAIEEALQLLDADLPMSTPPGFHPVLAIRGRQS
jgi:hypothetical protein